MLLTHRMHRRHWLKGCSAAIALSASAPTTVAADDTELRQSALAATKKAATYFQSRVAKHGGCPITCLTCRGGWARRRGRKKSGSSRRDAGSRPTWRHLTQRATSFTWMPRANSGPDLRPAPIGRLDGEHRL
jgi:hypothetical protein